ncbi:RIP metalloprotease RseP [Luteimonas sp. MC1825]|uniref:RIP metalloprotease RseP n=1 Tax=Luteimonas sp. MC1825 TaxID=2761107 RepID=UPI001622375D|nr:RIP metalloprotease RseP [Luteimonas sp. MC1825]MBB6599164.1 RIP metalloprotease RseP [Luteimonas sp. MC1825]QOC89287.1 RIP metalloprotease RseP [Luteimonas sp. MC1825]
MSTFLGSVWWMIVSLGVLVTFHEFGHYWVARRNGVKVLRFSIGFGKPLWSRRGRDGTEYVIAALPLGGYVKMLDEREGDVDPAEAGQAFNRKSVWRRIAIVAAGPLANLLLCVALLWAMFVIGRPDFMPVLGQVSGIAAEAGLAPGDTVLAVGERATPTWSEAAIALTTAAMDRGDLDVRVRTAAGDEATRALRLSTLPADMDERRAVRAIGLVPRSHLLPAVVGSVREDGAAWGVLADGDRITAIDGNPVDSFDAIGPLVQALGEQGGTGMVEVQRDGERLALELAPALAEVEGREPFWALGITPDAARAPTPDALLRHGPLAALPAAVAETGRLASDSLGMIRRLLTGRASAENVSGPITIARYANASANLGPAWFLSFLALLSLSLAIINLLPIPILDGGHLLYYLIELVKGSPLGERAMVAGQYVGLAMLAGLMGLAFYNDILQLVR